MSFRICTHDAWGVVLVGEFESLEEARQAFASLCQDPWYRQDGTVRGVELLDAGQAAAGQPGGSPQRLDWFAF